MGQKNFKNLIFLSLLIVLAVAFFCRAEDIIYPDKNWKESTPEEQGVDSQKIYEMFNKIKNEKLPVHNVLIIRNGYLITEANFGEFNRDVKHPI